MYAKKGSNVKIIAILLALVLLIGGAIGGTVAYLKLSTTPVVNTFVVGDIGALTLTETNDDGANGVYTIIPGKNIKKLPVVNYTPAAANSVDAYVFVKVDVTTGDGKWAVNGHSYSFDSGKITWSVDNTVWNAVAGETGVFYKEVDTSQATLNVMTKDANNNTMTVSSDIVQGDVANIASGIGSITFTAYAIQKDGFATPAAAWAQAQITG